MKIEEIYNKWNEFVNNPIYKIYFQSNEDVWNDTLAEALDKIFNKLSN